MRRAACLLAVAAALLPGGCRRAMTSAPTDPPPGVTAADLTAAVQPLELAPVSTFEQACARCHGPQGSFYGEGFGGLHGAELRETVHDMMTGPGFLSPSEAEVDAMTAYHRALAAGEPFICISGIKTADDGPITVRGECSPDAALSLTAPSERDLGLDAEGRWQTALDGPGVLLLEASRDGRAARLRCPPGQWTHSTGD